MDYLKSYNIRHAMSVGSAVLVAVLVNDYFSFSKEMWMVMAAFFVGQTTRGTVLRQSMIVFTIMIAAVLMSSLVTLLVKGPLMMDVILGLLFITSGYILFIYQPLLNKTFFILILFLMIVLIATLLPVKTSHFIQNRMMDTVLGALIGIICGQLIFPVQLDKEFRQGIVPLLGVLSDYLKELSAYMLYQKNETEMLYDKKLRLEKTLCAQESAYPVWVYETGFNVGLRSGLRYFLVHLERITEIFFSMNDLASRRVGRDLLENIAGLISNAMKKNDELFSVLVNYFENKKFKNNKLTEISSDYTSDISELETELNRIVPRSLELLDMSLDYLTLTAFVRDIKDLRKLLLELIMTLPDEAHPHA